MIRRLVSPWNQESTVEEVALAQGSGVAIYADTAEGRTFFNLAEPFRAPQVTVDPSGRTGVPVRIGGRTMNHVVSVSRAIPEAATANQEARLLETVVDLRPLFQPIRAAQWRDRAGHLLESEVSRLSHPGAAGFDADALLGAAVAESDHADYRYQYAAGWLVDRVGAGRERAFSGVAPVAGVTGIPINSGSTRDWPTGVRATRTFESQNRNQPGRVTNLVSVTGELRQLEGNPYLPDARGPWTAWTTTELEGSGGDVFRTEEIYDARGQLSVRRVVKRTAAGAPAIKLAYQLPAPIPADWVATNSTTATWEARDGAWRTKLILGPGGLTADTDFLYFFILTTNAVTPRLLLVDDQGRQVVVESGEVGRRDARINFWPLSPALSQWLPNATAPSQAANVAAPPWLPTGQQALAVSLAELVRAGLVGQLSQIELEVSQPIGFTALGRLQRGARLVSLRGAERWVREGQNSPHDFHRITMVPVNRSASAVWAGEDVQTLVERNGRPMAMTQPPIRRSPYPLVNIFSTTPNGVPRPLYQLSAEDGHFQQRFEVVSQPDAVQVYSVTQGFELPRFEVFNSRILGEEISPGFVAYGYDYHARVALTKGYGVLGRPLAILRNRVAANSFNYAGNRLLERLVTMDPVGTTAPRFDYGSLHNALVQAADIRRLPTVAEALASARSLPWEGWLPTNVPVNLDLPRVATELQQLHVERFPTNLTRTFSGTYLIPTALDTVAERYVDTVGEAEITSLAIKLGEMGIARDLLQFYWDKSNGGREPVQESYDGVSGTALKRELAFSRPVQARPTAAAQLEVAKAALELADATIEARWESLAEELLRGLLDQFRPPPGEGPRGISELPYLSREAALGFVLWPEAARFPVEVNARALALLERVAIRRPTLPADPEFMAMIRDAITGQREWLAQEVLPEVVRTGVVPSALFEVQDVFGETVALAPERWTSPAAWLAFLEVAERLGVAPGQARLWLDNLARIHGTTVNGVWGLDWSLPLLRAEAISPELTAHFGRVAEQLGHEPAGLFTRQGLVQLAINGEFLAARTAGVAERPLKSEQGVVVYPRRIGGGWPRTFGVEHELTANQAPLVRASTSTRLKPDREIPTRYPRTDLAVFIALAAAFYGGVLVVTLIWWRFRKLRGQAPDAAHNPLLVPEAVLRRAEERWATRVLGMQSPDGAACTRFSNATVEQNFLMQLRALYKLLLDWRRRENRWDEDDPRLVSDASDPWLNGLDEFASVVGLYLRWVIKAGCKDGFHREHPLEGCEDGNHIWARLVMYLSEHYWVLLGLMRKYEALPTEAERALFEWEFTKELETLGVRRRRESFDARALFNFPTNPQALDLLLMQKPDATLSAVMEAAAKAFNTPLAHLMRIVENYRQWKRRESPFPIHPYLIEFAKIFPNFVLTGLGALIWYNQTLGDSPILPYLVSQATAFALDPASLLWLLPVLASLVLAGVAQFVRTYRFQGSLLPRERPSLILDTRMTGFFRRFDAAGEGVRTGWRWNPRIYQRASWALRAVGWSLIAWTLFQIPTPSFATFLIVKGILAMLAVTEVVGVVLPMVATGVSMAVQDFVSRRGKGGGVLSFLNRLNITATQPASPLWLSVRYYLRPSVPSGDTASLVQAIGFYLGLNFVFLWVGAYLCQQILPLWFTETYLNASTGKLFVGGLLFWNTLYLLRYGLFLLVTATASGFATFPLRSFAALAATASLVIALLPETVGVNVSRFEPFAWLVALSLVGLAIWETPLCAAARRIFRRAPRERNMASSRPADPASTVGMVYMSGDDLSSLKLTPALLMTRWRVLRDKLGSTGLGLLHRITNHPTDSELEGHFARLFELEKRHAVTLWHPRQLVTANQVPSFDPALGL
ncbi:MAG TPA: hypothetical protein PLX89_26070, partial [Verrucomicrobiota bacterium]|nr:hypothetical protein [Verrucomicrobiota bacterium]